ncbi:MAG TPA: c-type cytochrome [Gemmatimonadaceae bacterium]|nr:c-type cytochrome [Gemmatimonadaceae bacterium]
MTQTMIQRVARPAIVLALAAACRETKGGAAPTHSDAPPAIAYPSHIAAGGAVPRGTTLTNPYAGDTAAVTAGAALFTAMNCDGCHGGGATGWVGPSLADGRWRYGGAAGEIFSSIYDGRRQGMPAFGGIMPAAGIWKLVTYLQSLEPPNDVPTESWK